MKTKLFLILTIALFFCSSAFANASVYVSPEVTGVIASSDVAYRPNVIYPEWNTISGNYLYYGSNWDNVFTIVDISDRLNPVEMSSLHDGDTGAIIKSPKGVMVVGDYAYLINWDNATGNEIVEILNVADKSNPYHVSSYTYTFGTGDRTYSLFVKDDYVYIPTPANNSLMILDVSDKNNPVLAGSILNGAGGAKLATPYNVSVVGNYAYVTSYGSDALEVIDVTDKTNPAHVTYLLNGTDGAKLDGAAGLQIVGNYAYIMSYNSKALEIVDISSSTNPVHSAFLSDATDGAKIYGFELTVNGNYAYLSSYLGSALEVVDISNPAAPSHVAVLSDGDGGVALHRPRSVSYYNDTLYISVTGSNIIEIIDVSTPSSPVHINAIEPSINLGGPRFIKIRNDFAYVTNNVSNAFQIVDVSNKNNPAPRGSIALRYDGAKLYGPLGLDLRENYAYVVSTASNYGFGALEIIDISDPDNPVHVNSIVDGIYSGGAQNIKIVGDYGYVTASARNTLEIIDIGSNPTNPVHIGSITNGDGGASLATPFGVDVVGNYAYVTTSNALEIVDISNPASPTHVGSLANGVGGAMLSGAKYVNVVGNYAYISSSGSSALEIVDISNPASPTHVGSLANGAGGAILGGAYGISIYDNRAYIGASTGNSLEIVDVSNPASPTHLYSVSDGEDGARLVSARCVDIDGDYVYITAYNGSSNAVNIIKIKEAAPTNLYYNTPNNYIKDSTITALSPTITGDNITYSIYPSLPSGLSIEPLTGVISGTPTEASARKTYTVTATNVGGSVTFDLLIQINSFNYSPVLLPPAVGSGESSNSIAMGESANIGTLTNSGTNILGYINSQANFQAPESSNGNQLASHSLSISNLDLATNMITLTIASAPQTLTMQKGETKLVDLDGDGVNDIEVTFADVYVNRAEITVKALNGQTSTVVTTETPVTVTTDSTNNTEAVTKEELKLTTKTNTSLIKRLAGRILLQVETKGQAWYLDKASLERYYLADGPSAYQALRKFGLGITNTDLAKIPVAPTSVLPSDYVKSTNYSTSLTNRLLGRIVLQVENHGEAWYINPTDGYRYYLANGDAAYQIMRNLSLGINNTNIRQITVGSWK